MFIFKFRSPAPPASSPSQSPSSPIHCSCCSPTKSAALSHAPVPRQIFPLSYSSIFSVNCALSVPGVYPDRVGALNSPSKSTTLPPLKLKPLPNALFSLFSKNDEKLSPSFSNSSPLFQKECSHNSFPINSFRTLSQNTGGGGLLLLAKPLSTHNRFPHFPQPIPRTTSVRADMRSLPPEFRVSIFEFRLINQERTSQDRRRSRSSGAAAIPSRRSSSA